MSKFQYFDQVSSWQYVELIVRGRGWEAEVFPNTLLESVIH